VIPKVPLIELEREPQGRLRWLAEDEEVRLLAACKASGDPDLVNTVAVAMGSGLRQGEQFDLTWDRVDLSRGKILLEVTKSGKRREVPMRQKVYDILAAKTERTGRVWPKGFNRTRGSAPSSRPS
jgi:integrase